MRGRGRGVDGEGEVKGGRLLAQRRRAEGAGKGLWGLRRGGQAGGVLSATKSRTPHPHSAAPCCAPALSLSIPTS